MAYTYDITNNIGKLRLMIGDTDITPTTDAQFTDEELQYFITLHSGNLNLAAADALGAWIGSLTREFKSEKIGDYSYTRDSIANMNKLKKEYEDKDKETPVFEWSEPDLSGVEDTTVSEDLE